MLQETDPALMNLIALRDLAIPLAREKEKQGKLNLNIYMSSCNTDGCLGGWMCTIDYFKDRGIKFVLYGDQLIPTFAGLVGGTALAKFFGLHTTENAMLFGKSYTGGNLDKREAFLNKLIAERTAALCSK